ncbi:MAG TPA: membrane protein insertase YidC [Candidatus Acidoferrum sp.]|nr:membrane protein insertase YidC [Candidatus Acidoferrum sp.]
MNVPGQKDKFTPELRILVASLLSMVVILAWAKYFGPKPPIQPPQANRPAHTAISGQAGASSPSAPGSQPSAASTIAAAPAPAPASVPRRSDSQERTIVIENNLYRVAFSNQGAVIRSWKLKKYTDDTKAPQKCRDGSNPPCVLDLVHPEASQQTGGWPFGLILDDEELQNATNGGLYQISTSANTLNAPADVEFTWSDGHVEVAKRFHFDHSYVVRAETSVKVNGSPVKAGLAWLGGFGDLTVANPAPIETVSAFYSTEGGKLTNFPHKKLEGIEKWSAVSWHWQAGVDYAGMEDRYFAMAFLPPNGAAPGTLETRYWKAWHNVKVEDKDTPEPVPNVAVSSSANPLSVRVYVGPKDYDDLKKMNPPLHGLVNFGWLEFVADPLFHGLKWLHSYIPNWGWSIVVLTLILNMLLFPLRISGYKTTLKMQRVAPEIKSINDRYKKYKLNDPKQQEKNKEIMAIYSREGINPVGGCIPQLLQLPIWYGLYRALQGTIELRHAPWFGWITDLSAKDPYYILPLLMGLSMYLVSKMTPMTSTDPQQQAMMKVMPIGMAALFMVIPYPSGLAVYILTSSLVGIGQQWYLNRKHPLSAPGNPGKPARGKNGKKS